MNTKNELIDKVTTVHESILMLASPLAEYGKVQGNHGKTLRYLAYISKDMDTIIKILKTSN
jgi:hypothetical protein